MNQAIESKFLFPENKEWGEAACRGELLIKSCNACDERHYYPRPFCPYCFSEDTRFEKSAGSGKIYTYAISRMKDQMHVLAYVTLDEGPTLLTNIVDSDAADIAIGAPVVVSFRDSAMDFPAPMFRVVVDASNSSKGGA